MIDGRSAMTFLFLFLTFFFAGCGGEAAVNEAKDNTPNKKSAKIRDPYSYKFEFYLNEEIVNGDVYFNGIFMGSTFNGLIEINRSTTLDRGNLTFVGLDESGEKYEIVFEMRDEDSRYISFTFTDEDISSPLHISKINESELRNNVFQLINIKRSAHNISKVERDAILDEVAQDYAERIKETGLFAHTPEVGYDLHARIKEKRIYYSTAAEVLSLSYFSENEDFASQVVDGWISSPGHRSAVLEADKPIIRESVGVGVSCKQNIEGIICYSVAVFASLDLKISDDLFMGHFTHIPLYDKGYGLGFPVNARIIFNSTEKMDIILLNSTKEYEKLIKQGFYRELFYKQRINFFDEIVELKEGYVLVVFASLAGSNYSINVLYNQ